MGRAPSRGALVALLHDRCRGRSAGGHPAPPAALGVLRQTGLGNGHGEEPPALLGTERGPFAANHRKLVVVGRPGRPGEDAEFLPEQAIYKVGARAPAPGCDFGSLKPIVELAPGDVRDAGPDGTG